MRLRLCVVAIVLLGVVLVVSGRAPDAPAPPWDGGSTHPVDVSIRSNGLSSPKAPSGHGIPAPGVSEEPDDEGVSVPGDAEGPPYPRLGMWWLDLDTATPEAIARYDLVLNEFDEPEYVEKLREVRAINPTIRIFRPISPTEQSWEYNGANPLVRDLPSAFFVTTLGTTLAAPVSKTQTTIPVRSLTQPDGSSKFSVGDTIVIGTGESAKVVGIDAHNKVLTVQRGFIRPAAVHLADEYVAAHVTFWPESWVMNVAGTCPRVTVPWVDRPVNWVELYRSLLITPTVPGLEWNGDYINQAEVGYDGIVIDRFEDRESWLAEGDDGETLLDLYQNNTRVSSAAFDASWKLGVDQLRGLLKQSYPELALIRNNPLSLEYGSYNGQVYEQSGWAAPTSPWWHAFFTQTDTADYYRNGCYLDWFTWGARPLYVMVEVYQDESFPGESAGSDASPGSVTLDYQRMRLSLTSTLLGDGYYSYELSTSVHGSGGLFWFDEYDNAGAGKGYLGYPAGPALRLSSGAYRRIFDRGLVLVNPQATPVRILLEEPYERIAGSQAPSVNDGRISSVVELDAWDGIILLHPHRVGSDA
jgi:hypothetical protein